MGLILTGVVSGCGSEPSQSSQLLSASTASTTNPGSSMTGLPYIPVTPSPSPSLFPPPQDFTNCPGTSKMIQILNGGHSLLLSCNSKNVSTGTQGNFSIEIYAGSRCNYGYDNSRCTIDVSLQPGQQPSYIIGYLGDVNPTWVEGIGAADQNNYLLSACSYN